MAFMKLDDCELSLLSKMGCNILYLHKLRSVRERVNPANYSLMFNVKFKLFALRIFVCVVIQDKWLV